MISQAALAQDTRSSGPVYSEADIEALKDQLDEARARVSELETELENAQNTIQALEGNRTAQAGKNMDDPKLKTVRGQPLYDETNPKQPIAPRTVLAEKFDSESQGQPVAMTRLLEDDMIRGRVRHIDRISNHVPNMMFGQSGNEARLAIRGMRTNRTGPEADPIMAIYEDGVSVPTTTQAMEPYVDINRIEVLRGPQGVLYGRNAFGGAINIISNEPDPSGWDAAFEGEFGYADGTRFDAMLNMPVTDTITTRFAARYDLHSGYINNRVLEGDADDLRDRKQQFVRWMTSWKPSDRFELLVNLVSYDQNQTGSGIWGYHQKGAYVDGDYVDGHQFLPADYILRDLDGWTVSRNTASLADQENLSGTLRVRWDMGFANLEWFINKSKFENQQIFDSDYSDGGDRFNSEFSGLNSFRDSLSSEIRLFSHQDQRFQWLAGLNWMDQESNWGWLKTTNGVYSQPDWDSTGIYKTDSVSAFARAAYQLTDDLNLSGGLRYYDDSKTLRTGETGNWDGILWNAALTWAISDDMNAWFSASTGYRPGGLNAMSGVPASFDSEHITAYEAGLKSVMADGSLVMNLSAFINDYKDIQAQSFTILPLPGEAGLMDYMTTAGDMASKGFEAEIQWLPGTHWNISANLAWLDAEFKNYRVPAIAGLGDIPGHSMGDMLSLDSWRPAMSPEWSMGLQASYIVDLGRSGTFTPMLQTTYVGDYYANDINLPGAKHPSYTKTDLRLFWHLPGNKLSFHFYLENIEEEMDMNHVMIYNPEERPEIATLLANWGDPRTYGITMSYRW
jgi:outer membrane receptor protein involved in Fe transport